MATVSPRSLIITAYIAPKSTLDIPVSPDLTIGGLREKVYNEARAVLGDRGDTINKDSILISSDVHGSGYFAEDDVELRSLPDYASSKFYAVVSTGGTDTSPGATPAASSSRQALQARFADVQAKNAKGRAANTRILVERLDKQRETERGNWLETMRMELEASIERKTADLNTSWERKMNDLNTGWERKMNDLNTGWERKMKENTADLNTSWERKMNKEVSDLKRSQADWDKKQYTSQQDAKEQYALLNSKYKDLQIAKEESEKVLVNQVKWQQSSAAQLTLLDSVILRNLVDQAQGRLAVAAGLLIEGSRASLAWRLLFDSQTPDPERLRAAKELFAKRGDKDAKDALEVLNSAAGTLVVEQWSAIRQAGDTAAHGPLSPDELQFTIDRQPAEKRNKILALVNFVCG